jgi:hypothetical protein
MVNEGSTYSIDDLLTEQTNTYVATDIDLLHKGPKFKNDHPWVTLKTASNIVMEAAKERMRGHRSPFL